MKFADDTWKWLEDFLQKDIEASTGKLYNRNATLEEVRLLQGRLELARTLLASPVADQFTALKRK